MKIFYTGIGANSNGIHTPIEFLEIMKNNFLFTNLYYLVNGNSHDPMVLQNFFLGDWIKWAGAYIAL